MIEGAFVPGISPPKSNSTNNVPLSKGAISHAKGNVGRSLGRVVIPLEAPGLLGLEEGTKLKIDSLKIHERLAKT